MDSYHFRNVTVNCFQLAINDLTQALSFYEQEQYAFSENKIADVIYRITSALHLINRQKEQYNHFDEDTIDT